MYACTYVASTCSLALVGVYVWMRPWEREKKDGGMEGGRAVGNQRSGVGKQRSGVGLGLKELLAALRPLTLN